jgi:para-aminobenzoate synthetase component 1
MMHAIGLEDWKRWHSEGCTLLPAAHALAGQALPDNWRAFADGPATVWLESAQDGRYSYICDRPERVIIGDHSGASIRAGSGGEFTERRDGKPLEVLEAFRKQNVTPVLQGGPAMMGGLIGVFGYDLVHTWEKLPRTARRDLDLPLYAAMEVRDLFVFDHVEHTVIAVVWTSVRADDGDLHRAFSAAQRQVAAALARWKTKVECAAFASAQTSRVVSSAEPQQAVLAPPPSFASAGFQAAVRRVQDYIAAGHTYQVNLSLRTSRPTSVPAVEIYDALRRVNPSPYMGLLRLPEFALVCGSPELLVRVAEGVVSSRPIAGTRPRGQAAPEDSHFSAELFASEKERAEHLMLVDLIRNDIGRVAQFGSVSVRDFMALERYSHVMHIVSQVDGRLAPGKSWADVLRSMFPGGTITGCPKIRTMEIIEELEPVGRGFYTGALGWISYAGAMEMNIIIRSMLVQDGVAHVQAGAGIVADSKPERELDESLRKAQALWVALERATNRSDG